MELLLPAERLLQAVDGLTGGLQDALSVPHANLPGSGLRTDGADGKQLPVTSPRHPWPAVVPGCGRLHLLQVHVYTVQTDPQQFLDAFLFLQMNADLDLPLCCLFPLRAVKLSLLLPPTHRDKLPCKSISYPGD